MPRRPAAVTLYRWRWKIADMVVRRFEQVPTLLRITSLIRWRICWLCFTRRGGLTNGVGLCRPRATDRMPVQQMSEQDGGLCPQGRRTFRCRHCGRFICSAASTRAGDQNAAARCEQPSVPPYAANPVGLRDQ